MAENNDAQKGLKLIIPTAAIIATGCYMISVVGEHRRPGSTPAKT